MYEILKKIILSILKNNKKCDGSKKGQESAEKQKLCVFVSRGNAGKSIKAGEAINNSQMKYQEAEG